MDNSATLLSALLQKYPDLEQLSDERLQGSLADIFAGNKEAQKTAFDLIRSGRLEGHPVPQKKTNASAAPRPLTKAEKSKMLESHPQMPYPRYTIWEDIRDYYQDVLHLVLNMLWAGGVIAGIPTYLLTLFFSYIDKSSWNTYVWWTYGALLLYVLYKYVQDFSDTVVHSMRNPRNNDVDRLERLQSIIAKKGLREKAENMMRTVYNDIRLNKTSYYRNQKIRMLTVAYEKALEDILCYFSEDERWEYLEAYDMKGLNIYTHLFRKYYSYDAFNPYLDSKMEMIGEDFSLNFEPIPCASAFGTIICGGPAQ